MNSKQYITTKGSININLPIDQVFDFFANPSHDKLWRTEINQSELDGPWQQGVKVTEYSYLSKKVSNNAIVLTCVTLEKNSIAVFETSENAPFYLKSQREVKSISGDVTEVVYTLTFDKSIVRFALGFDLPKLIISYKAHADMKKYLKQLKTHLEGK